MDKSRIYLSTIAPDAVRAAKEYGSEIRRCGWGGQKKAGGYSVQHPPRSLSYEIGNNLAMDAMGLQPLFLLGIRLGEGSGCPLAFEVLSAACAVINDMATFDQAGIDDGYLDCDYIYSDAERYSETLILRRFPP